MPPPTCCKTEPIFISSLHFRVQLMIKHDIGRLPVVDAGKVIGIFSRSDAVADLYGLCLLGDDLATGCKQNKFSFDT